MTPPGRWTERAHLARETAAPVREWTDAARKAAAWRLEHERAAAMHALARSGVEILDVSPEELTGNVPKIVETPRR